MDYKVDKVFESLVDNDYCQIELYFPKLTTAKGDVSELNKILEKYADLEYYTHRCDEAKNEKTIIKGDFEIALLKDTILSIEFLTLIVHFGGNRMDTVYHSIVMNPNKINEKEFSYFQLSPEFIFPKFDRGILKPYVKKFNELNNKSINLLAYEIDSNYRITWGMTKDKFVIYVGGEGECFGYDKIEIPMSIINSMR